MDSINVMPFVFGGLAIVFGLNVLRYVLQIVRHPGRETSPPLLAGAEPARPAAPAEPSRGPSLVDRALGLVVLGLLFVSRARGHDASGG